MLGIDIGAYSIKAAVVKRSGKKFSIEQVASEVLPMDKRGGIIDADTLRSLVSKVIKRAGKGQSAVALSVPTSSAIFKTLQVDANMSEDALEGEVQLELVNFVPFPPDQVYSDFVRMGPSEAVEGKEDIFVAASRRDLVDKVANAVAVKSIKRKEVDIEAFAIGQLLELMKGKDSRDAYAVIDVGYKASTFCVFQGGNMLFSREQQVGGHNLTEAIAESQGVDISEAENMKHNAIASVPEAIVDGYLDSVSEQVAMGLEFFSSSNDTILQTVYITGGGSMVAGLLENLADNIPSYDFEMLPLGQSIQIGKKTNGMSLESIVATTAVATGLAMRK